MLQRWWFPQKCLWWFHNGSLFIMLELWWALPASWHIHLPASPLVYQVMKKLTFVKLWSHVIWLATCTVGKSLLLNVFVLSAMRIELQDRLSELVQKTYVYSAYLDIIDLKFSHTAQLISQCLVLGPVTFVIYRNLQVCIIALYCVWSYTG